MKKYIKQITKDKDLQIIQDNIDKVFQSLDILPILSPVYVDITLQSSTETLISHNLQRNITGWLIIQKNANADVYQTSLTPLKLISTNTVTVKVMVF